MKPTLEQVIAFAQDGPPAEPVPGPYKIALTLAHALLASGRYGEDAGAAIDKAWRLVPDFYAGQLAYKSQVTTLAGIAGQRQADGAAAAAVAQTIDAAMSPVEMRAYVTGGETGDTGEARGSQTIHLPPVFTPDQVAERGKRIAETTAEVQRQWADLERFKATRPADTAKRKLAAWEKDLAAREAAYTEACALQSKAYE